MGRPARLAHYVAQMMHESSRFRYDREIWGPTPAQKRYDTRTDLGNSPEKDGDGKKYSGRTVIQITGKSNYKQFTSWCRKLDSGAPDFVGNPELVNTDPWEGLGPLWYWSTRKLNAPADKNLLEKVTRKINGGTNGLADRYQCYDRAALVLLGYSPTDVRSFQEAHGLKPDNISGLNTRAALHTALQQLPDLSVDALRTTSVWGVLFDIIAKLLKGLSK